MIQEYLQPPKDLNCDGAEGCWVPRLGLEMLSWEP
jgi:hypothetical protein